MKASTLGLGGGLDEGVVTIEFGRLDQTHDGGSPFASAQAAGK